MWPSDVSFHHKDLTGPGWSFVLILNFSLLLFKFFLALLVNVLMKLKKKVLLYLVWDFLENAMVVMISTVLSGILKVPLQLGDVIARITNTSVVITAMLKNV